MKHLIPLFGATVLGVILISVTTSFALTRPESIFESAPFVTKTLVATSTTLLPSDPRIPSEFLQLSEPGPIPSHPPSVYLQSPPLEYLRRVTGNPKVKKGELSVQVPILMYHRVRYLPLHPKPKEIPYSVSPDVFRAQMEGLVRAGYHTITPDDLDQALRDDGGTGAMTQPLPSKPVLITFDDGYRDQYENAVPILKEFRLKATFFVVTQIGQLKGFMTEQMIRELDQQGFTIAAHTRHHPWLTKYGKTSQMDEIKGSKQDLEIMLGHSVTSFAYPYGALSEQVKKEVEQAGYHLGFWVRLGSIHTTSSRYELRRIQIRDHEDLVPLLDQFSTTTVIGIKK
ncbi:polysaccharide deacetylase family protein [Candidatus Uhrbacteria bacterium]|nr:polysaccharide deacetylase family protein [Candidatus Uhrbacteria bacterium]